MEELRDIYGTKRIGRKRVEYIHLISLYLHERMRKTLCTTFQISQLSYMIDLHLCGSDVHYGDIMYSTLMG